MEGRLYSLTWTISVSQYREKADSFDAKLESTTTADSVGDGEPKVQVNMIHC